MSNCYKLYTDRSLHYFLLMLGSTAVEPSSAVWTIAGRQ